MLEPKLQEVRAETIRECNKKTMSIIEQVVLEDAIIKFNSTPQIGELFDIEKHNHANKMLNGMNSYIYEKLKEYFSH